MSTTSVPSRCMEQNTFPSALGEISLLHRGLHKEVASERKRGVKNEDEELVLGLKKKKRSLRA